MKVRTLSRFEDSHPFVSEVPAEARAGDQFAAALGVITVKQKLGNTTALCAHVATFPAGVELTEDNCPDLATRVNEGSDRYPGWLDQNLVEVIE